MTLTPDRRETALQRGDQLWARMRDALDAGLQVLQEIAAGYGVAVP